MPLGVAEFVPSGDGVRGRQIAAAQLCVDGQEFAAVLDLNVDEHDDRVRRGLGAVASKGLLHALWTLPEGITFPRGALEPMDLETLGIEGGPWVEDDGVSIARRYRPIGSIDLVVAGHRSVGRAIERVAKYPPAFRRLAVWLTDTPNVSQRRAVLERAAQAGIGIAAAGDWGCSLLSEPAPKLAGRPAVYRWWLAEITYRNWLLQTAPTE